MWLELRQLRSRSIQTLAGRMVQVYISYPLTADRGRRLQVPRCPPPADRSGTRSDPAGCGSDGKHWQTHFGWSFYRTHRRCAACAGNGVQGPCSHLPSRRKAGRGFPFHPLLVFQMPLLAIFSRLMLRSFRPIPVIFYRTKGRRGATAA